MLKSLASAARAYLAFKSERERRRLIGLRSPQRPSIGKARRLKSNRRWQEWEIKWLGKVSDPVAVRKTGRTLSAVSTKRVELKIPAVRTNKVPWTKQQIALLGKLPDRDVARLIGCTYGNVSRKRLEMRIPYQAQKLRYWTADEDRLIGSMPDADLAQRLRRSREAVQARREKLGIAVAPNPKFRPWTAQEIALLGTRTTN